MRCFHCDDSNSCSCISCVIDTPQGTAPGPCQACKGRRRADAMRSFLVSRGIDSGDRQWWRREGNKRAQSSSRLVFMGDELFDEWVAGGGK